MSYFCYEDAQRVVSSGIPASTLEEGVSNGSPRGEVLGLKNVGNVKLDKCTTDREAVKNMIRDILK